MRWKRLTRWRHLVGGVALALAAGSGCKQQIFLTEAHYNHVQSLAAQLPKDLERNPAHSSITPDLTGKITPAPATVFDPEREVRYLTLQEAIALALENGNIGQGQDEGLSHVSTVGVIGGNIDTQNIRVQALEPAIQGAIIDAALSRFDTNWVTALQWNNTDRPVGTALDAFQAARGGINAIESTDAQFRTSLVKPLPTGGVAGITFATDYQFTNLPARVNPSYRPSLQFQFEQPLLRGWGVEINQLREQHPGARFFQALQTLGPENINARGGILIQRIRYDQQRAALEVFVNRLLLEVENAYWNLYGAFGELYAREVALRQNLEVWKVTKDRVEAGVKEFTLADLYSAQAQYETSRSEWLAALGRVLERERTLRALLGLPAEDGKRLVPADPPILAPYQPDWESALTEALMLRPELVIARDNLKAAQLNVLERKNALLPDLRFGASYDVNAIGNHLSGPDADNALRNLASNHFNNWTIGLQMNVPLGYRDAESGVRQARLRLAQYYWTLRTAEDKVQRSLAFQYRNVLEYQKHIEILRRSVDAYNNELTIRRLAREKTLPVDTTLQSIRLGAAAMIQYYQFIAQYNAALANFEHAKGTLMRHDNVIIGEGELPAAVGKRASEHVRERAQALVCRMREQPSCSPGVAVPPSEVLALPELLKSRPPMPPEVMEVLPPPRLQEAPPAGDRPAALPPQNLPGTGAAPSAGTITFSKPADPPVREPAPPSKLPTFPGATRPLAPGAMRPLVFPDDKPVKLPPVDASPQMR